MTTYLVLEDPKRFYRNGTQLQDAQAREATTRGVALIPIDPNVYQIGSAASGFFRADYGMGWPFPAMAGPFAPLTLCLRPITCAVHWRAALWFDKEEDAYGQVRLTADSSQYGLPYSITSDAVQLEPFKGQKVVVVGGMSLLPSPQGGMAGFCLWGSGGARLLWAAISQTSRPNGSYLVNPIAMGDGSEG